jgi:alkanesulfonate monooxygenase SsuD/methylene tetrahydromethanopterin reductase-like flavin-dependent oxidoreductase (luciferase family)
MRGFGIDATVPVDVAAQVAIRAEESGYTSFWVNGSPPDRALDVIEQAAQHTSLAVGVGVFPLTKITAADLVAEVDRRDLPQDRVWLGVGSGRSPGALGEVREAVHTLRTELDVRVVTAAVGPKMTALAGEVADAVIFTWWVAAEVERSRLLLEESAVGADRAPPAVVSYIRCGLVPQAAAAVAERAELYDTIPRYREVFARNGITAADTVITGASRAELLPGIEREASVIDVPVIRAIPEADTVAALSDLVAACAP